MTETLDERMKRIDDMEDLIISRLGSEQALVEVSKALDYDTKDEIYKYIIRMWDLNYNPDNPDGYDEGGTAK